jgi:predicted nucleotidyltransferase
MMQKLWQKKLKLSYSKDVFDIVQFGSSVLEESEPNDVDIAVIFGSIPLKEQLVQAQKIKKILEKYVEIPVHVKSFDLYSLFEKSNFARESILFGISLISGKHFAGRVGLIPKIHISYSLQKLHKREKIKFNYLLGGKKGKYGLLRKHGGRLIKPGLIEIDPVKELIFVGGIKKITGDFRVERVMRV